MFSSVGIAVPATGSCNSAYRSRVRVSYLTIRYYYRKSVEIVVDIFKKDHPQFKKKSL